MAISKTIIHPTYFIPLQYHRLHEYCVHKSGVVVANVNSYFSQEAADAAGVQPLLKNAIQVVGIPDADVEAWIYTQLVLAQSGDVETVPILERNKYSWASGYTPQDRFYFEGGTVVP